MVFALGTHSWHALVLEGWPVGTKVPETRQPAAQSPLRQKFPPLTPQVWFCRAAVQALVAAAVLQTSHGLLGL